jgi:hypothetical protein
LEKSGENAQVHFALSGEGKFSGNRFSFPTLVVGSDQIGHFVVGGGGSIVSSHEKNQAVPAVGRYQVEEFDEFFALID